jgi:hypothetical protein
MVEFSLRAPIMLMAGGGLISTRVTLYFILDIFCLIYNWVARFSSCVTFGRRITWVHGLVAVTFGRYITGLHGLVAVTFGRYITGLRDLLAVLLLGDI